MLITLSAVLKSKIQVNHDTWLFSFDILNGDELSFITGQYLIIFVPQEEGDAKRRLLSLVTTPEKKKYFELLLQIVPGGIVSEYLKNAPIGLQITCQGPAGIFILHESPRDKIFIATGTGIAPIKSMLNTIFNDVSAFTFHASLLWGMRHLKDVYFFEEFKRLSEQNPNFDFKICLSQEKNLNSVLPHDRKYFELGRVTTHLDQRFTLHNKDFYICGGRDAVESLRQFLYEKAVSKEQIYFEKF